MGIKEQSQKDHGEIFVRNKKTNEKFRREQANTRDLTILGWQRDGDGQNKHLQINGSKDSSRYIINRMNLIQF
jgi:hypothetical protein